MHIAWLGHPGSGRTTLAALLAHVWAEGGDRVLAVDAASRPRLARRLGVRGLGRILAEPAADGQAPQRLRPVQRGTDLVGAFGGAPTASLQALQLHAGHEETDADGDAAPGAADAAMDCACMVNGAQRLRESIAAFAPLHVVADHDPALLPFARGEVDANVCALVIVEPYRRALDTAARIVAALREPQRRGAMSPAAAAATWRVVANKVHDEDDRAAVEAFCRRHELPVFAWIGLDVALEDPQAPLPTGRVAFAAMRELAARLPRD